MRLSKTILAIVACVALSPFPTSAQNSSLVRLSFSSGWDALPAIVAIERGFFDQEGLVVSGLAVTSADATITSIIAGSTDIASVPQRTLLLMAAAKLPVKVVGMNGWKTEMELVVPADSENVKLIADLKGKTVALGVASESFPVFIRLLNAAGLRPGDVKILSLEGADLLSVFDSRSADAVFESRYYTSAMVQNGKARVFLSDDEIRNRLGTIGAKPLIANTTFLEQEQDSAQKFLNAWVKALVYIQQDPEDAAHLLQIFFHRQGTTVLTELAETWIGITHYDRYTWSEDAIADAEYNGWGLVEGQILKVIPELDTYIENRFAQEAWDRLQ